MKYVCHKIEQKSRTSQTLVSTVWLGFLQHFIVCLKLTIQSTTLFIVFCSKWFRNVLLVVKVYFHEKVNSELA